MSPCLGRNLYAIFALSNKLSNGGGNIKSSSVGILISGSKVSNPSPKSIPSIGGGWRIFLFCSSIILFLSSSKSLSSLSFLSSNSLLLFSISLIILGIGLSLPTSSPFSHDGVEESILLGVKGCVCVWEGNAIGVPTILVFGLAPPCTIGVC